MKQTKLIKAYEKYKLWLFLGIAALVLVGFSNQSRAGITTAPYIIGLIMIGLGIALVLIGIGIVPGIGLILGGIAIMFGTAYLTSLLSDLGIWAYVIGGALLLLVFSSRRR